MIGEGEVMIGEGGMMIGEGWMMIGEGGMMIGEGWMMIGEGGRSAGIAREGAPLTISTGIALDAPPDSLNPTKISNTLLLCFGDCRNIP